MENNRVLLQIFTNFVLLRNLRRRKHVYKRWENVTIFW